MLGSHFARTILELPWRIGEDRFELASTDEVAKVVADE